MYVGYATDRQTDKCHKTTHFAGNNQTIYVESAEGHFFHGLMQVDSLFTKISVNKKPSCRYDSQPYCLTADYLEISDCL